ncbi:MAG TPA: heme lyase CcmF/NrfE family subunit [Candidatus Polarisedimenticolia bacterium]|nr:heme lyase CcmF/NrfE family subunit [Candidatus Polarisedimenticolia bacterium]
MGDFGSICLSLALMAAVWGVLVSWLGHQNRYSELVRSGERAAWAVAALLTLSTLSLVRAFLADDFSILYVAQNSNRTQPDLYKISALWGGQSGSLLLWVWILSAYAALVAFQNRSRHRELMPAVNGTLLAVISFFLLMLQFVSNPFEPSHGRLADGMGLNPLLQNPFMASHPPSLYLGYVGVSVPFAFAMGALMTGRLGNEWIVTIRRWSLFAWFFLGIGILQGGYWAYIELGWGGYWAWDPVENASLMPWLTMTAFIHSVMIQEKKGMLKVWNVMLVLMSFSLSIFGTFITRSGVVSSVHSFTKSSLGPWFATFWVAAILVSVTLLVIRLPQLRAENRLESLLSRESAFLFNNILFIAICFTVFWGTVYPILSEAIQGFKVSVGPPWFNQWIVPLGLALIFVTGVGPLIAWRRASGQNLKKNFMVPGAAGLATAVVCFAAGMRHMRALLAFALCAFVLAAIVLELHRGARARMKSAGEGYAQGLMELVGRNKRRYGGYFVHVGMVMIFVGIAGSSAFQQEAVATLRRGESFSLGPYTMTFADTASSHDEHKDVLSATLTVDRGGERVAVLKPEKRFYRAVEQPTTEVAIHGMFQWPPNIGEDLYAILVDNNPQTGGYTFKAYLNPLVSWVWLGGFVVILGTHVAVLPEWRRRTVPRETASVEVPSVAS